MDRSYIKIYLKPLIIRKVKYKKHIEILFHYGKDNYFQNINIKSTTEDIDKCAYGPLLVRIKEKEAINLRVEGHGCGWGRVPGSAWREKRRESNAILFQ